jgi:hypothetical protein
VECRRTYRKRQRRKHEERKREERILVGEGGYGSAYLLPQTYRRQWYAGEKKR